MLPGCDDGGEPVLVHRGPQILQPGGVGHCEGGPADVRIGRSPPQRERLSEQLGGGFRFAAVQRAPAMRGQIGEALGVDRGRGCPKCVSGSLEHQ